MSGKIGFKFCYLNNQKSETEQIKYTCLHTLLRFIQIKNTGNAIAFSVFFI